MPAQKIGMTMKHRLPGYLVGKNQLVGTVVFSVLFALIFLNIYIPFSDTAWFRLGNSQMFLFTAGFAFISILILVASRAVMYKVARIIDFTYAGYILWCVSEVVLICAFYTFVTADMVGLPPGTPMWSIFLKSLLYGSISLLIPYILSGMYFTIVDKDRTIRLMTFHDMARDGGAPARPDDKITLFDNSGALKLSVRASDLFYIESDDNYIKVWYADSKGEMKAYMLRCRLKTVEQSFKGTSLVRCHRQYIVNLDKVKILRKEKDVYYMDLDNEAAVPLPVSRTYSEDVVSRFLKENPEKVQDAASGSLPGSPGGAEP